MSLFACDDTPKVTFRVINFATREVWKNKNYTLSYTALMVRDKLNAKARETGPSAYSAWGVYDSKGQTVDYRVHK
jgi:hypothetical protein